QRTTDPVSPNAGEVNHWTDAVGELAAACKYIGALLGAGDSLGLGTGLVPLVSGFAQVQTQFKYRLSEGVVISPPDAFLSQKVYFPNFLDLEFTLPMAGEDAFGQVNEAFYQLVDCMEEWRAGAHSNRYPVNLNVHARFIKNSQATLSPAYAEAGAPTHTAYF